MLCGPLFVFSGVCVAQSLTFYVVLCGPLFVFSGLRVAQSLTFYVVLCGPLFVLVEAYKLAHSKLRNNLCNAEDEKKDQ